MRRQHERIVFLAPGGRLGHRRAHRAPRPGHPRRPRPELTQEAALNRCWRADVNAISSAPSTPRPLDGSLRCRPRAGVSFHAHDSPHRRPEPLPPGPDRLSADAPSGVIPLLVAQLRHGAARRPPGGGFC